MKRYLGTQYRPTNNNNNNKNWHLMREPLRTSGLKEGAARAVAE
jgi:hypothetical protein